MSASPDIPIHFSESNRLGLYLCLGLVMFGVALGLRKETLLYVFRKPKALLVGLFAQCVLLPAITLLTVYLTRPSPGIACGMFLVAAVPGGNVSNFICKIAGGNIALSVALTLVSTLTAILVTPLNFAFWSSLYPPVSGLRATFSVSIPQTAETILYLTVIPVTAAMLLTYAKPKLAERMEKPMNTFSGLLFTAFVVMAFWQNRDAFIEFAGRAFFYVLLMNATGFVVSLYFARLTGISKPDQKTVSIETGIQNAGMALVLILQFFGANGEAALTAAIWGIWHIISGMLWGWVLRRY